MSHSREPVKQTCPDIDRAIKSIKSCILRQREIDNMAEEDLRDTVSTMNSELEDCIGVLEGLRKSNEALRNWGDEEAKAVDDLEEKYFALTQI